MTTIADLIRMHEAIAASLDTSRPGNNDWRFAALGAYTEIGEVFAHLPWRPWRASDSRQPTAEELDLALVARRVGADVCTRAQLRLTNSGHKCRRLAQSTAKRNALTPSSACRALTIHTL